MDGVLISLQRRKEKEEKERLEKNEKKRKKAEKKDKKDKDRKNKKDKKDKEKKKDHNQSFYYSLFYQTTKFLQKNTKKQISVVISGTNAPNTCCNFPGLGFIASSFFSFSLTTIGTTTGT